jgi:hypothetical protein
MGRVYQQAEKYLDQLADGRWVEIGCGRAGDDGSTQVIAEWAKSRGRRFTTVDMDPINCSLVQTLNLPNVEIINSTGQKYLLASKKENISFLYLDNFDWDWHPDKTDMLAPLEFAPNGRPVVGVPGNAVLEQRHRYQTLGMPEMNNVNSQCNHLMQMEIAISMMSTCSLVVCDDTWFNKWWGHYSGKCGAVVPYLINHGYSVLHTEEEPVYGTILGRGIKS